MKKHNPLTLDIVTDEPNFETDVCKWWLCEESKNKKYCVYLTLHKKSDEMNYVVVNNKFHEIIFYTQVLEQALMHLTMCEKSEELNK